MGEVYEIRPLEWHSDEELGAVAVTIVGRYAVRLGYSLGDSPLKRNQWRWMTGGIGGVCQEVDSLEAGKLAAEAHYRERLKQALAPSPLVEAARELVSLTGCGMTHEEFAKRQAAAIAKLTEALPQEGA